MMSKFALVWFPRWCGLLCPLIYSLPARCQWDRDIKAGVNTYFENEKRTYGYLMAHVLGGNEQAALQYLQAQDHQHREWHALTIEIDYFACFTLEHQVRKYFYFGDLLRPDYKQSMLDGARRWTEQDPLNRHQLANPYASSGMTTPANLASGVMASHVTCRNSRSTIAPLSKLPGAVAN